MVLRHEGQKSQPMHAIKEDMSWLKEKEKQQGKENLLAEKHRAENMLVKLAAENTLENLAQDAELAEEEQLLQCQCNNSVLVSA